MTTPLWCLVALVLIPYVLAPIGGYFKSKQYGSLDNKNPRVQSAGLGGAGARAVAAQENTWEALAVFSVAVLVNHLAGADPESSATASMLFLATRIVHPIMYIADLDKLRSGVFVVGIASVVWMFVLAGQA